MKSSVRLAANARCCNVIISFTIVSLNWICCRASSIFSSFTKGCSRYWVMNVVIWFSCTGSGFTSQLVHFSQFSDIWFFLSATSLLKYLFFIIIIKKTDYIWYFLLKLLSVFNFLDVLWNYDWKMLQL